VITLRRLCASVPESELKGIVDPGKPVMGVTSDSRTAGPGLVFVALRGEKVNGHRYVGDAVARGCVAAVVEDEADLPPDLPLVKVADSHRAYGLMAAEFHGHPARAMKIIGLTGTNGKTTTSWLIEQVIRAGGGRPGVIGTVNYRYPGPGGKNVELDAPLTTPESMILQALLRQMHDAGVTHVILEVSSHSLAQKRLAGLLFDVGVFTNLSRVHLDYHGTMEAYFRAKQKGFEEYLQPSGIAVVAVGPDMKNTKMDRDWGRILVALLKDRGFAPYPAKENKAAYMTCGFDRDCTVRAEDVRQDIRGLSCAFVLAGKRMKMESTLIGRHNISNMLAATATGVALGMEHESILRGLREVQRIPGRLERVRLPGFSGGGGPTVFVDYAHTPDALENVLKTLRPVTPGRLFCIFGCGGDRVQGKRPLMGAVAADLAHAIIVTSDNPRGEDPAAILSEIEQGLTGAGLRKCGLDELFAHPESAKGYVVLENRRRAIHLACSRAVKGDVVLIAGKGHETYQITAAGRQFFDDRIEARNGCLRWTAGHLIAATGGRLTHRGKDIFTDRISTDTRSLERGDVFVALRGENFDGHDYVEAAVNKGAAAIIVERECPGVKEAAVIMVPDTLHALGELARYRRLLASDVKVVGITGSSGKTTVKEMTASIFAAEFERIPGHPVLKTQGNLNNLIGLPLSLLAVNGGHRVAVLEMGMNKPGEIKRLARIAEPDIGCITNIQAAHLEGLGSIEGVARAKGELFAAMADRGIRVINYDDPHVWKLGGGHGNSVVGFAVTSVGRRRKPAVRATRIISLGEKGMRFTLQVYGWKKRITVSATGAHNVANCAAAAAIAIAAGVDPEVVARGLARYRSGDKRLEIINLAGGIKVVNESYNANPASMAAALRTVAGFGTNCRRGALLGDMFELGQGAVEAHRGIGKLVAQLGYDYLVVTGEFGATVAETARQSGMKRSGIMVCGDKEALAGWIEKLVWEKKIGRDDWLLIKGSRGMRMEQVLEALERKLNPEQN
jgi:murE/murF fusion protein